MRGTHRLRARPAPVRRPGPGAAGPAIRRAVCPRRGAHPATRRPRRRGNCAAGPWRIPAEPSPIPEGSSARRSGPPRSRPAGNRCRRRAGKIRAPGCGPRPAKDGGARRSGRSAIAAPSAVRRPGPHPNPAVRFQSRAAIRPPIRSGRFPRPKPAPGSSARSAGSRPRSGGSRRPSETFAAGRHPARTTSSRRVWRPGRSRPLPPP